MSIASTTRRNDYDADGTSSSYDYTFKVFAETDLLVTVKDTSDPDAVDQELALTTDYTVTGVQELAGGTIEFVDAGQDWIDGDGDLADGWHLTIRRVRPLTQLTDIRNQGPYYAKLHEDAFDHVVMICQQQQDEIDRSIKLPETSDPGDFDLHLPASIADNPGAAIIVNETGDGFDVGPDADAIADAQANAESAEADAASAAVSAASAAASAAAALYRWGGSAGGTGDALTLTPSPTLTSYSAGIRYAFLATATNTGPATVNISGLGAQAIKDLAGSALAAGAIASGRLYSLSYDGTNFRLHDMQLGSGSVTAAMLTASTLGMSMVNGTLTAAVGSGALTVAIKTKAGTDPSATDPVYILFRNATAATGDYTVLTLTAATSFVVSSTSTLGTANSTPFRLWVVGFNDGGTFRLGVINCLSYVAGTYAKVYPLGQFPIASSTAEGGAGGADSAHVFYTGAAVTSKAYVVLGYLTWESGLSTAGTWDALPTRSHLQAQGDPLPGALIQSKYSTDGVQSSGGSNPIPGDNTIPQSSEGFQVMTDSISPASAADLLEIEARVTAGQAGDCEITAALFKDSEANAVAAVRNKTAGSTLGQSHMTLLHQRLAGSTSSQAYKVRMGAQDNTTVYFNGLNGTQMMGGVMNSLMLLKEVMA